MSKNRVLITAAVALAFVSGGAIAADVQKVAFSYKKSDLETSNGVAEVLNRIERAAQRQCVSERAQGQIPAHAFPECKRDVEMNLVTQIGHPGLLAMAGARQNLASRD